MSGAIDMTNGRANMAYLGKMPWHGLGASMTEGATFEQWIEAAGLAWSAQLSRVAFRPEYSGNPESKLREIAECRAVYRADTGKCLGIVGARWKPVQPREAIEFFQEIASAEGWKMETAGCLRGGRTIWGLAKMPESFEVTKGDRVDRYASFSTAYDGTRATTVDETDIRIVCANTLKASAESKGRGSVVSLRHTNDYDRAKMHEAFASARAFEEFAKFAKRAATFPMSPAATVDSFLAAFKMPSTAELAAMPESPATERARNSARLLLARLSDVYQNAPGQAGIQGTAWGALNAVTRYIDHDAPSRNSANDSAAANRWHSALFGNGALVKGRMLANLRALVPA